MFLRLFQDVLRQCIENWLTGRRLVATDSTYVKANVSRASAELVEISESPSSYEERLDTYEEVGLHELEHRRTGKQRKTRASRSKRITGGRKSG